MGISLVEFLNGCGSCYMDIVLCDYEDDEELENLTQELFLCN